MPYYRKRYGTQTHSTFGKRKRRQASRIGGAVRRSPARAVARVGASLRKAFKVRGLGRRIQRFRNGGRKLTFEERVLDTMSPPTAFTATADNIITSYSNTKQRLAARVYTLGDIPSEYKNASNRSTYGIPYQHNSWHLREKLLNAFGVPANSTDWVYVKHASTTHRVTNQSNLPCMLEYWVCEARNDYSFVMNDTATGVLMDGKQLEPLDTWVNGMANADNLGASSLNIEDAGCQPVLSQSFTRCYKIVKHKKLVLGGGKSLRFSTKSPRVVRESKTDYIVGDSGNYGSSVSIRRGTRFHMIRFYYQLATDQTNHTTHAAYPAGTLSIQTVVNYVCNSGITPGIQKGVLDNFVNYLTATAPDLPVEVTEQLNN